MEGEKHPEAAALLAVDDVLVDLAMRGRSSTWTRIRVNLRHVSGGNPASIQETPDPNYDPSTGVVVALMPGEASHAGLTAAGEDLF